MAEVNLNKLSAPKTKVIDWDKCCLCQVVKEEDLRHPYKKKQYHSAYDTLKTNLLDFQELDNVPMGIDINTLNDGSGIAKLLSYYFKPISTN